MLDSVQHQADTVSAVEPVGLPTMCGTAMRLLPLPQVKKVVDAVEMVRQLRPNMKVEGPIQYDAAIDPAVAAVKVKTSSEVAGKANVFIFPDLNTGEQPVGQLPACAQGMLP